MRFCVKEIAPDPPSCISAGFNGSPPDNQLAAIFAPGRLSPFVSGGESVVILL